MKNKGISTETTMEKASFVILSTLLITVLFFPFKKYIFQALMSFFVVFISMPYYINWAFEKKIVNKDYHKPSKPDLADMGGFVLILSFFIGMFLLFPFIKGFDLLQLTTAAFTILLVSFIGAFDDLFKLNEWQKIALILIASIPVASVFSGETILTLPFLGTIDIGLFYPFVVVPGFILVLSNSTNMLAGYNGLESGLAIISLASFSIYFITHGIYTPLILISPFLGALLAFFYYNKIPAKVILGDVGTLPIGTLYAIIAIISSKEYFSLSLLSLYLINFVVYFIFFFFVRGKGAHISEADEKGFLKPTYYMKNGKKYPPWHKIYFLMEYLYKGRLTEEKLVQNFLIIQTVISVLVLILFY